MIPVRLSLSNNKLARERIAPYQDDGRVGDASAQIAAAPPATAAIALAGLSEWLK